MYMLLQMQEIGIFLIKMSVIMFCLFVAVLIILAGREMWRDKKREMKQSAVFADNVPDEINRKDIHPEETDKEKRMTEANIRLRRNTNIGRKIITITEKCTENH